ncbi:MAG: sugar phosphate nucleotidyltransferase, partial [Metallosphaera sp.]
MQWSPEDIKVIIPIGGEATRMRPLTVETSKATVRLLNRPLLEFPILELAKQGVKEFIFGVKGYVNYKSLFDTFKEGIGFSARYRIKPRVHFKYQPRVDSVGNADSVRINMDY